MTDLPRRLCAEAVGSFFLFCCVSGSGIMAERLAGGNVAVALLANSVAIGALLFVLITVLGPVSGAHMNPAVSLVAAIRRELRWSDAALYSLVQLGFGIVGILATHLMFELPLIQTSVKVRTGPGQWLGEVIATFGLILTVLGTVRYRQPWVPATASLYIVAAIWFTSSFSFANPAITIARSLTDTFVGIAGRDVAMFVVGQLVGAVLGALAARALFGRDEASL